MQIMYNICPWYCRNPAES